MNKLFPEDLAFKPPATELTLTFCKLLEMSAILPSKGNHLGAMFLGPVPLDERQTSFRWSTAFYEDLNHVHGNRFIHHVSVLFRWGILSGFQLSCPQARVFDRFCAMSASPLLWRPSYGQVCTGCCWNLSTSPEIAFTQSLTLRWRACHNKIYCLEDYALFSVLLYSFSVLLTFFYLLSFQIIIFHKDNFISVNIFFWAWKNQYQSKLTCSAQIWMLLLFPLVIKIC